MSKVAELVDIELAQLDSLSYDAPFDFKTKAQILSKNIEWARRYGSLLMRYADAAHTCRLQLVQPHVFVAADETSLVAASDNMTDDESEYITVLPGEGVHFDPEVGLWVKHRDCSKWPSGVSFELLLSMT